MFLKYGDAATFVLVLLSCIFVTNGLQCYHCRLNLCDHEHCDSAMSLLKESSPEAADYIGVYNWSTIAPCPADWQSASQSGSPAHASEYNQTCGNLGDMCGQLVYNITTKSVLNIVANDSQAVPVIGSGTKVYKSAVVVLGCIPISHKCRSGFKQSDVHEHKNSGTTTMAPSTSSTAAPVNSSAEADGRVIESKLSNLQNVNTVSNCCHCDTDLCNGNDLISNNGTVPETQKLQCTNGMAIHEPVFDDPIVSTAGEPITHAHSVIAIFAPLIAAVLMVPK